MVKTLHTSVHLVATSEGFTVVQAGKQSGAEDPGSYLGWIACVGRDHPVNVLPPSCWTTNIQRVARGANPELILTGGEDEMGGTVGHSEDSTQTYNHLFGVRCPFIVMTWGESYHFSRLRRANAAVGS